MTAYPVGSWDFRDSPTRNPGGVALTIVEMGTYRRDLAPLGIDLRQRFHRGATAGL